MTYTTVSADVIYSAHFGAAMKAECAAAQSCVPIRQTSAVMPLRMAKSGQRDSSSQPSDLESDALPLPPPDLTSCVHLAQIRAAQRPPLSMIN